MLHLNFHPFPVLETERLLLRQINEQDIPLLFEMRRDYEVMKYVGRDPATTIEQAKELSEKFIAGWKENTGLTWVIQLKENPDLAGTMGFWRIEKDNHRGEVGYMLRKEFFNKGIATEALQAALAYGFETLKFHSVEGNVNPENEASIKVLERAGFVKEAHFRENYYFDGKFFDSGSYSLLAKDRQKMHSEGS